MKKIFFTLLNSPGPLKTGIPAFFFLLILIFVSTLSAQSDLSLRGQVLDSRTGQPINDALVTVTPEGLRTYTDPNGNFEFYYLKPGVVSLKIFAYGYQPVENVRVEIHSDLSGQATVLMQRLEYQGEDQVVIATEMPGHFYKHVIRTDSPQFAAAENLGEMLKYLPGVIVQSTGGGNQRATVSINGGPAKHTGIYLDGVPLNSHLTGDFDINLIPKQAVEKIEIYENGHSGELGGNSLLGAINIVTRKAAVETKFTAAQQRGSFNSNSTDLTLQNILSNKLSSLIIFSRNTASNNFDYNDPKYGDTIRQNNYRDIENIYLNLNYKLNSNDQLSVMFSESSSKSGLPGALYELTPTAGKSEHFRTLSASTEIRLNKNLHLRGNLQYFLSHQHFSDRENFYPYDSKYRDSRLNMNWLTSIYLHPNHKLNGRLDFNSNKFTQLNILNSGDTGLRVIEKRLKTGLGYEGIYALNHPLLFFNYLNLNAATSVSSSDLLKPLYSSSVRLGLEKDFGIRMVTHLSYSNSYREPSYSSLFWSEDAFSLGNPDLLPEKSEEFSGGLKIILPVLGGWNFGVDYSHTYIKDLIFWHRRFDGKYEPRNLAGALISALHWRAEWNLAANRGRIACDYTLSNPRDRSFTVNQHDNMLTFYPRKLLDISIQIQPGFFNLGWNTRYVSERFIRTANTKILDSYTVTDIHLGIHQKIAAFDVGANFRVNNLFSETYQIIERYPLPLRSYSFNISLTYKHNTGGKHVF